MEKDLAIVIAALIVAGAILWSSPVKVSSRSLAERVETLTTALKESAEIIDDFEGEIQRREQIVAKLKEDAKLAEQLKTLNQAQLDGVNAVFAQQLEEANRHGFWANAWVTFVGGAFFYLLGLFTQLIFQKMHMSRLLTGGR